jgi:ribosomal protein S18 acetylase RimI-like enzyme
MTISIDELERVAADGWQATEQVALGDWLLRAAGGFTGRANSALAVGDPGLPLPLAIDHVRQWYQARGLPAMVAVGYPLDQPEDNPVDIYLAEAGWSVHHGAIAMTTAADAGAAEAGAAGPPDGPVRIEVADEPGDGWLDLYRYRGGVPPPISRRLLVSAPWQAFASVRLAGETVAIGRVAAARGWAGLTAVEVHPGHRRRGLGRVITAALVRAAADRGRNGIYLQVEDTNLAARALYQGMGFADHHGYHYRIERPAP